VGRAFGRPHGTYKTRCPLRPCQLGNASDRRTESATMVAINREIVRGYMRTDWLPYAAIFGIPIAGALGLWLFSVWWGG
jgi:hypothetical protein